MTSYRSLAADGIRWRVAESARDLFTTGPLAGFPARLREGTVLKDLRIKRVVEIPGAGGPYLVKVHKGGGVWPRLKALLFGPRAARELRNQERASLRGIPTLPVLAAGHRGRESFVVIRRDASYETLDRLLLEGPGSRRRRLIEEYGRWARAVHDAGVAQYDFNPTNVLARREGRPDLKLVDFERVRFARGLSPARRMAALAKIDRMIPATRADRLRFLRGYLGDGARDRAALRGTLARLAAAAERQRRRDAERRAGSCVRENRNYGRFQRGPVWGFYRKGRDGAPGLRPDEVEAAVRGGGGFRRMASERALLTWREANAWEVSDPPVAVVVRKGSEAGDLLYRAGPPS